MKKLGDLNVYSSETPHEDVWIVGDTTALYALKYAIEQAITRGNAGCSAFANDGEGYNVIVLRTPGHVEIGELAPHYAQPNWDRGKYPIAMVGVERYQKLVEELKKERTREELKRPEHEQCSDCDNLSDYHRDETYVAHCICGGEMFNEKCEDDKS